MHQSESSLLIEEWPIDRVRPCPDNPRIISEQAISKVAASIKAFGWRQPIVVDEREEIVIGHVRREAALSLGLTFVPVHVARGLTPAQIKALRLADNRTNEEARWDPKSLTVNLQDLLVGGFDLALTGFDPVELPTINAPSFEPVAGDSVKRLDKRAEVTCPGCGQKFQP